MAFVLTAFFSLSPATVFAQNLNVQFEQTPLFSSANFLPGDTITRFVKVTNNSGETKKIGTKSISVVDPDNLGSALNLVIRKNGDVLYNNLLSEFFAAGEVYLADQENGVLTQYDYTVGFVAESGNPYQGKALVFDIVVGFLTTEGGSTGGGSTSGGGGGSYGGGGGGTTQNLVIFNEAIIVSTSSAAISWETNLPATTWVVYSNEDEPHLLDLNAPNFGYAHAMPVFENSDLVINHKMDLLGLSPNTVYFYRNVSRLSTPTVSVEHNFITPAPDELVLGEKIFGEEPSGNGDDAGPTETPVSPGRKIIDFFEQTLGTKIIDEAESQTDSETGINFNTTTMPGLNCPNCPSFLSICGTYRGLFWLFLVIAIIMTYLYLREKQNQKKSAQKPPTNQNN